MNDDTENELIYLWAGGYSWIGYKYSFMGWWWWVDYTSSGYTNWGSGYPILDGTDTNCARFDASSSVWVNDV